MTNRHREKFITRLLAGFALTSGGVLVLLYAALKLKDHQEWYMWGAISIIFLNTGLFLLGSAFVHKIKADLIRKQKQKDQHKKYEFE